MANECSHRNLLANAPAASGNGCEECLKAGQKWVELRICQSCGHVGCCDSTQCLQSASRAESCIWGAVDQNLRQHCDQYRVLQLFLRQRWRSQDLACPIQFHLRQQGEQLDDRGSPFVGHASAPKVIPRSVMKRLAGLHYRRAMVLGCDAASHSFMQAARSDW